MGYKHAFDYAGGDGQWNSPSDNIQARGMRHWNQIQWHHQFAGSS